MSVRTRADEHLDVTKEHVKTALLELIEVTIVGCWGSDEFTPEYTAKLREVQHKLMEIKDLLS